jgi:hypothetical protein
MNLANPPSNEPLLNYLTEEFIARGYDMKWLHREIATSRTYQLSWQTNETNQHDARNFSRSVIRRLPAEVAYDAILHATADDTEMETMHADVSKRYIGVNSSFGQGNNGRGGNYVMTLFGKPARLTNCDCERSNEPSLLQTIFLRNDQEVLSLLDRNGGWLRQISRPQRTGPSEDQADSLQRLQARIARLKKDGRDEDAEKIQGELDRLRQTIRGEVQSIDSRTLATSNDQELIREAYLRTVSRLPTEQELQTASAYLSESDDRLAGMRDLLWALLNTKEFIVNR